MNADTQALPRVHLETLRLLHREYQAATRLLEALPGDAPAWGKWAAVSNHNEVRQRVLDALAEYLGDNHE